MENMLAQIMQMLKDQNRCLIKIESSIKMTSQSLMANALRLMEWNVNGLLRHQHELEVILSTENIDICLIAETHFTKESFIRFRNYISYHTNHPANTARGGSAVILRNNIKHFEEEKYVTCDIQATIVTAETSKVQFIAHKDITSMQMSSKHYLTK
jgi:exonuclease III